MRLIRNMLSSGNGRGIEYRAPVDSAREEPPYRSAKIMRWVVLDGRRMQRHAGLHDAFSDKPARRRIAWAALIMLPTIVFYALAGVLAGFGSGFVFGGLGWLFFGITAGAVTGVVGAVVAAVAAMFVAMSYADRFFGPLLKARGLSHDEEKAALLALIIPLAVLVLVIQISRYGVAL